MNNSFFLFLQMCLPSPRHSIVVTRTTQPASVGLKTPKRRHSVSLLAIGKVSGDFFVVGVTRRFAPTKMGSDWQKEQMVILKCLYRCFVNFKTIKKLGHQKWQENKFAKGAHFVFGWELIDAAPRKPSGYGILTIGIA